MDVPADVGKALGIVDRHALERPLEQASAGFVSPIECPSVIPVQVSHHLPEGVRPPPPNIAPANAASAQSHPANAACSPATMPGQGQGEVEVEMQIAGT